MHLNDNANKFHGKFKCPLAKSQFKHFLTYWMEFQLIIVGVRLI